MDTINKQNAPVGSRILVTDSDHPSLQKPYEIQIKEWSKKGRVKIEYLSGALVWLDTNKLPLLMEVLNENDN